MKEHKIETIVKEYSYDELSRADRLLVDTAKEMTRTSLAPYSKFCVGAAIEMADGTIVRGSNQENAAYPSGTCAERTACYQASALHPGMAMKKIAIAARQDNGEALSSEDAFEASFQFNPISPCGACRQALLEYEHLYGPIEVLLYGQRGILHLPSVTALMPLAFVEF